jgi:hypothetical protein
MEGEVQHALDGESQRGYTIQSAEELIGSRYSKMLPKIREQIK